MSILGTNVSDIPESIGTVTWCSGLHDVIADIGIFQWQCALDRLDYLGVSSGRCLFLMTNVIGLLLLIV